MYPKVKVKQQQEEEELQDHHHPSEEEFQRIFLKDFKSMSTSLYHHHHPSNSNSNPNPNPNPKSPPEHKHGYTPPHVRVPISGANKKISSTSSSRSKVVNKNIITGDEVTNYTEKPPSSVLPAPRAVLSSPGTIIYIFIHRNKYYLSYLHLPLPHVKIGFLDVIDRATRE
uniref:uncharacterized protein LOC122585928 isoform X1 n=1 Tax=Erigeron canadensis TaxID=72917 RepID=UPI001CB96148|nr:uncharacterized protein LOC122585928 isoform X1 [Erigeron canadensis]